MSADPDRDRGPAPTAAGDSPSDEYSDRVWPRLYAAVLGILVVDIAVFAALTVWFR